MKKFLALVLALTLVVSLFTVNVMAGSKAHTFTINADKTTDLKAGDVVKVQVTIDGTVGIGDCTYVLSYDTSAFEIDKTIDEDDYVAYVDMDWIDDITYNKGSYKDWTKTLSSLMYTPGADGEGKDGEIKFQWYGSSGVSTDYPDAVLGLFYIKVKDGAAGGNYTFSLTGHTGDAVENDTAAIVCAPVTVTVAGAAPVTPSISTAEPTATEAGIAVERADGTKFTYDNCYTVTVSMTNANDATKAGMQFIPKKVYENANNTWAGYAEVEFAADGLGAGERAYTAALINIPRKLAGQNIDMMARGFMVVNGETLTGTVVESVVNYEVTPEPGQN